jgi:hypothetical protein
MSSRTGSDRVADPVTLDHAEGVAAARERHERLTRLGQLVRMKEPTAAATPRVIDAIIVSDGLGLVWVAVVRLWVAHERNR